MSVPAHHLQKVKIAGLNPVYKYIKWKGQTRCLAVTFHDFRNVNILGISTNTPWCLTECFFKQINYDLSTCRFLGTTNRFRPWLVLLLCLRINSAKMASHNSFCSQSQRFPRHRAASDDAWDTCLRKSLSMVLNWHESLILNSRLCMEVSVLGMVVLTGKRI